MVAVGVFLLNKTQTGDLNTPVQSVNTKVTRNISIAACVFYKARMERHQNVLSLLVVLSGVIISVQTGKILEKKLRTALCSSQLFLLNQAISNFFCKVKRRNNAQSWAKRKNPYQHLGFIFLLIAQGHAVVFCVNSLCLFFQM